jgi:hypothetical protein
MGKSGKMIGKMWENHGNTEKSYGKNVGNL